MSCDDKDVSGEMLMRDGTVVSFDGLPSIAFHVLFDKLPNTVFFLQNVTIPGISITPVLVETPWLQIKEIGEKIEYPAFRLSFLVDANFKNYKEIHDWMKRIAANQSQEDEVSDFILIINNRKTLKCIDCWPSNLSGITFSANAEKLDYLTATVDLNYDYYELT